MVLMTRGPNCKGTGEHPCYTFDTAEMRASERVARYNPRGERWPWEYFSATYHCLDPATEPPP